MIVWLNCGRSYDDELWESVCGTAVTVQEREEELKRKQGETEAEFEAKLREVEASTSLAAQRANETHSFQLLELNRTASFRLESVRRTALQRMAVMTSRGTLVGTFRAWCMYVQRWLLPVCLCACVACSCGCIVSAKGVARR